MQDSALSDKRYGPIISGATGKYYDTRVATAGMTIPNNPKCLSRPLGA